MANLQTAIELAHDYTYDKGYPITITADGMDVLKQETPENVEQTIKDIIAQYNPQILEIWLLARNGADRNGNIRYKKSDNSMLHHVIKMHEEKQGLSGIAESARPEAVRGFEDATILEDDDEGGIGSAKMPGGMPNPDKMSRAAFAYMITNQSLSEAKSKISTLENQLEALKKEVIDKDRQILDNTHEIKEYERRLEDSKSTKAMLAGIGEVAASSPAVANLIGKLFGGGTPASPQMSGPQVSEAAAQIDAMIGGSDPDLQQKVFTLIDMAVDAYNNGNTMIFDELVNSMESALDGVAINGFAK